MSQVLLSSAFAKKDGATWEDMQQDIDQFVKLVSVLHRLFNICKSVGIVRKINFSNHDEFIGSGVTFKTRKIQTVHNEC